MSLMNRNPHSFYLINRVNLWLQILTFEAYFQEALWEVDKCPFQIRKVKIFYFPEDGTIQVNEPKVDNSGMTQGTLPVIF